MRRGVVGLVAGSGVLGGVWWGFVCEFSLRLFLFLMSCVF